MAIKIRYDKSVYHPVNKGIVISGGKAGKIFKVGVSCNQYGQYEITQHPVAYQDGIPVDSTTWPGMTNHDCNLTDAFQIAENRILNAFYAEGRREELAETTTTRNSFDVAAADEEEYDDCGGKGEEGPAEDTKEIRTLNLLRDVHTILDSFKTRRYRGIQTRLLDLIIELEEKNYWREYDHLNIK